MCDLITAVLPEAAPHARLDALARMRGRQLLAYANPSLSRQLRGDQRCFLTTLGHCDCGTILGSALRRAPGAADPEAERERLRRKGWSEGKIARALADRQQHLDSAGRPATEASARELTMWATFIADVLGSGVREFGLLLHDYRGPLDEEMVLLGVESFAAGQALDDILLRMRHDVLYVFRTAQRA